MASLRLRFMFNLKRQSRSIENDYDLELSYLVMAKVLEE